MNTKTIYAYPKLSDKDYCWFRVGGPGLANCMFFAAKAYVYANTHNTKFINPTWRKFSIGPWLRKEKDKRVYNNLFYNIGLHGLKKFYALKFIPKHNIITFSELGNYFEDLNGHYDLVADMFNKIIRPETISLVEESTLENKIAIHVRLGDYLPHLRIKISWYKQIIENIIKLNPSTHFVLFSDGKDSELSELLEIANLKLAFYGNAFADMYAISKCKLVIASDSTFSAWGAFLGQKPIIFCRRHFPAIYRGNIPEIVLGESTIIPENFKSIILKNK